MNRIISIFFLVIISFQCLPLRDLGKCIFENSVVEEDISNSGIDKKEMKDFIKAQSTNDFNLQCSVSSLAFYNKENTLLYQNPVVDLSIQPPIV